MDNKDTAAPQGAKETNIYKVNTFVNQDGFKIEEHVGTIDESVPSQYYGFYLVNTEIGPIDRYFKFKGQSDLTECFDNFKTLAEEDAERLAEAMKKESEAMENERQEMDALKDVEAQIKAAEATVPPPVTEEPNTQFVDADGSHLT
tara:strand:- start:4735 stop:5172 length:438 start_codon:yes stop_codon:yes gene_type:complete